MKRKIRRNKRDKDGYEYNFEGLDIRDFKPARPPKRIPAPGEVAKMLRHAKIIIQDGKVILATSYRGKHYQKTVRKKSQQRNERGRRAA